MFCSKPIGSISETALVTTIPAHPYFWLKTREHDVTLTSFTADLSKTWKNHLIRAYNIDKRRAIQSLVAISLLLLAMWRKVERAIPPPSSGRELTVYLFIFYFFIANRYTSTKRRSQLLKAPTQTSWVPYIHVMTKKKQFAKGWHWLRIFQLKKNWIIWSQLSAPVWVSKEARGSVMNSLPYTGPPASIYCLNQKGWKEQPVRAGFDHRDAHRANSASWVAKSAKNWHFAKVLLTM